VKPHPRIRKTVKWGGAVVSVLLVVVWVGSGWWQVNVDLASGMHLEVFHGNVRAANLGAPYFAGQQGLHLNPREPVDSRWVLFFNRSVGSRAWEMTLWFPTAMTLLVTGVAWRLDTLARRRARVGLCPKCNYDRTGLPPGAVCPECGAAANRQPDRQGGLHADRAPPSPP
jgi:hypothetical protein